jgi:hypothetical protein
MYLLEYKGVRHKLRHVAIGTIVLLILATHPVGVHAQGELDRLREMWLNGQYAEVLPPLLDYRGLPNGRTAMVDYMIATSACHLANARADGLSYLQWILQNYRLTVDDRKVVESAMQQCATGGPPSDRNLLLLTERAEAGVRGKGGFVPVPGDPKKPAVTSTSIEFKSGIPVEDFSRRLFRPADREAAQRYVSQLVQRVSPDFHVAATDQFVLASSSGHSLAELLRIGRELENVLAFFKTEYGVTPPAYLITVYMVPSDSALGQFATKIHGLQLPDLTIGYSFQSDLSISGWIVLEYIGTLTHELFHLAVRGHFGDIPPWMDEGIAALYEEAEFKQGRLLGLKNWRGEILKQFWDSRPTIEQLVGMNWRSFDGLGPRRGPTDICRAVNHATARYFALLLQDQGILPVVYRAFHDRTPTDVHGDPGSDAARVLESTLHRSIGEIDLEFAKWFKTRP